MTAEYLLFNQINPKRYKTIKNWGSELNLLIEKMMPSPLYLISLIIC